MSTGILTFHRGPNYGGFLQAWHMREAIRPMGGGATLVNYQTEAHHRGERIRLPRPTPAALKGFLLHTLKSLPFRAPVAELSDHPFTTDPARVNWSSFSEVVVGADIVWDFSNAYFGPDPSFFGAHPAQAETRFVAYAPSCGEADVEGPLPDHVSEGLGRFSAIGVRDESTARLVERVTGVSPPLVVDPTWLQDDPVVSYRKRPRQPYVLVYGHGANGARADALGAYCRGRGLKLITCAFPCRTADRTILSIGPFEWVDLFRHAEAVVTSTFHGLLYAVKFGKPVLFMVRCPSRGKSELVVRRCGLSDRVVEEGRPFNTETLAQSLNPESPPRLPAEWIQESRSFLAKSLVARSGPDRT